MFGARLTAISSFFLLFPIGLCAQPRPRWEAFLEQAHAQSEGGDWSGAEQTYRTALSEAPTVEEPEVLFLVTASLGDLYRRQNRMDELEASYRQGLAAQEQKFGSRDARVAHWLTALGGILADRGKYEEAERLDLRAVEFYETQPGLQTENLMNSLRSLAGFYRAQGRNEQAAATANRWIEAARDRLSDSKVRFGDNHPAVAGSILELARAYSEAGQYDRAEAEMTRALEIYELSLADHPELSIHYAAALGEMAKLYQTIGRDEDANQFMARADELTAGSFHYERASAGR